MIEHRISLVFNKENIELLKRIFASEDGSPLYEGIDDKKILKSIPKMKNIDISLTSCRISFNSKKEMSIDVAKAISKNTSGIVDVFIEREDYSGCNYVLSKGHTIENLKWGKPSFEKRGNVYELVSTHPRFSKGSLFKTESIDINNYLGFKYN